MSRGLPKSVAGRCLLVASPSLCLEAGAVLPGQGSRPQHRWVFPGPHGPSEPGTAEQPEGGGPVPPVFSCLPPSTPLQRRANRVYLPGEHRSIPGVQHRRGDDAALGFRAGPCLRRVPSTAQRPGSSGTWSVSVSHTQVTSSPLQRAPQSTVDSGSAGNCPNSCVAWGRGGHGVQGLSRRKWGPHEDGSGLEKQGRGQERC